MRGRAVAHGVGPPFVSRFSRSSGWVDQIFFQCVGGKPANAVMSVAATSGIVLT